MVCPNCGTELPNGTKFCGACGQPIADAAENFQPEQNDYGFAPAPTAPKKPGIADAVKNFGVKKIVGIVAAVVVVIAAVFGIKGIISLFGGKDAYVYLSGGKYELITNLKKAETLEIDSSKGDYASSYYLSHLLSFSNDGKYIYFFTKVDNYAQTGTLNRAEYGKLKEDSSKNSKYIETIDSDILLGFAKFGDGIVYAREKDDAISLYYYDGKSSERFERDIHRTLGYDDKHFVYITENDDDEYTIYGVSADDISNKIELATGVDDYEYIDVDNILYTTGDKESGGIYAVGFNTEAVKLCDNGVDVDFLDFVEGKIFFVAENGKTISLYDYVEDSYADSDSKVTEPKRDDFTIPRYSYEMIASEYDGEGDYDELYTSCTEPLYWLGSSYYGSESMTSALNSSWYIGGGEDITDKLHPLLQNFINKYGSTADDNGYILVTDEIKNELKKIAALSGTGNGDEWLLLCYYKYESGSTVDYDAYSEAADKWYEVKDRVELRKELKDKENAYPVYTLYCYENGTVTTVNENVLDVDDWETGVIYTTTDLNYDRVSIDDIRYLSDVRDIFRTDKGAESYVTVSDGTTYQMSPEAAELIAKTEEESYTYFYFTSNKVYMESGDGEVYEANVTDGIVGEFEPIAEDADVIGIYDSTLYYVSDIYEGDYGEYGDLYSYTDSTATLLAKDISNDEYITVYTDGVIIGYTGDEELTVFDPKGDEFTLDEDISMFIRVDKNTILYISNDKLYCYDGKESYLIKKNVDYVWSKDSMDILFAY